MAQFCSIEYNKTMFKKQLHNEVIILGTTGVGSIAALEVLAEQYPLNLTIDAKGDTANISITGAIHRWQNNAEWFRAEVKKHQNNGVKNVKLYLNTPGGDVFQANEIGNIIESFEGEIHGEGGALVASAGTYLASKCKTFEMPENGKYMYHKPYGRIEGNEDQVTSKLELLKSTTSDYRKNYAELTGLTEEKIEENWSKGDVWLSAKKAVEQGFITSVKKRAKISAEDVALMAACGAPRIPKATKNDNKQMDELKVLALKLGLDENATQEQVDAKLAELRALETRTEIEKQNAQQKKERDEKEVQETFVANLVKDKKVTQAQVEEMKGWIASDFDGFKAWADKLQPLNKPQANGGESGTGGEALYAGKKFEDLTKEQASELEEENPERFSAMYDEYLERTNE